MNEISDKEILDLIRSGEMDKGFKILMHKYQERIYWILRGILGNHEDTDDVIQNTFIKSYRSILGFEERSSLYTWLYKIAINEAYTFLKSKRAKKALSIESEEIKLQESGEYDFNEDETDKKLKEAIEKLPEKQQQVFNLRYFGELSYKEMSELLSTSEGALKASYHLAVKKIESYLLT